MKRIMAGMITLLATAVILSGIAFAQTGSLPVGPFWFEFSGGLNLRDQPTSLGIVGQTSGYVVGNSYNFDYYPDGTARKRSGVTKDTIGINGANAVNFMAWLPINPNSGESGPVLAHSGTKWFTRVTDGTAAESAWTELNVATELASSDTGYIAYDIYGNALYVGSKVIPFSRFNGTGLYRVAIEDIPNYARATVDTIAIPADGTEGNLSDSTTYYYQHTYLSNGTQSDLTSHEGPATAPISATTDVVSKTIKYTIPANPSSIGTGIDSVQITGVNIYRSTDGANYYYYATVPSDAEEFYDSGQYTADQTKLAPLQQLYADSITSISEHGDFLFMIGSTQDTLWSGQLQLHSKTEVTGGFRYAFTVWGDADGSTKTDTLDVKAILESVIGARDVRIENADVSDNGTVTAYDASILKSYLNGSLSSDFDASITGLLSSWTSNSTLYEDGTNARTVTAVNSDTTFTISGDSLEQFTTHTYTLVSTSKAVRGIFLVGSDGNAPQLYNWSLPKSPMSKQSEMTRLLSGEGSLYILGRRGVWELVGYDADDFIVRSVLSRYGVVGAGAADTYLGGVMYYSDDGAYYVRSVNNPNRISDILGRAITDSTATNRISETLVRVFEDRIFISTPRSDGYSTVWVFDLIHGTWSKYIGWSVKSFGTWATSNDNADNLYIGDSRTSNIAKWDRSRTADISIAGADSAITAEIYTPRFNFGTDDAVWNELHLVMDTNDSVRVSFEIGAYDSTFTISPDVDGLSGPTPIARADSSMTSGVPKTYILPIRATGHTCRVHIWTQGTGRCTIYPSRILASRKEL